MRMLNSVELSVRELGMLKLTADFFAENPGSVVLSEAIMQTLIDEMSCTNWQKLNRKHGNM